MKRVRNPRFAPEFLERKLSPSSLIGDPAASAEVYRLSDTPPPPPPPPPPPSEYPWLDPIGPAGPA